MVNAQDVPPRSKKRDAFGIIRAWGLAINTVWRWLLGCGADLDIDPAAAGSGGIPPLSEWLALGIRAHYCIDRCHRLTCVTNEQAGTATLRKIDR
jgi:hypothetical protein